MPRWQASSPTWPSCTRPPARTCPRRPCSSGPWQPGRRPSGATTRPWRWLEENLGHVYHLLGRDGEAAALYQAALAIREATLGADHPKVAVTLDDLGDVLAATGRCAEALALYQRALAIRAGSFRPRASARGPQHRPHRGRRADSGRLRRRRGGLPGGSGPPQSGAGRQRRLRGRQPAASGRPGRRDRATPPRPRPLHEQAIAILEAAAGPEDLRLAASLEALAGYLVADDKQADAQPLLERALAIKEKHLGPVHADLAATLDRRWAAYWIPGAAAPTRCGTASAPCTSASIPSAPTTLLVAASLSHVGELYRARGQYALAEPLFEKALAIRDKLLGPDDADLAKSLADLAELYYVQGRYAAAEPLYERAIAIKEKVLGPDDPSLALCLNGLGGALLRPGALRGG